LAGYVATDGKMAGMMELYAFFRDVLLSLNYRNFKSKPDKINKLSHLMRCLTINLEYIDSSLEKVTDEMQRKLKAV